MSAVEDLQEPDIGPGRESGMALELGPERFHRRLFHIINQQYAVGITHGQGAQFHCLAIDIHGVDVLAAVGGKRNRRRIELGHTHVNHDHAFAPHAKLNHAFRGLNPDDFFIGQALIANESRETPGPVAALLHLGSVRIENSITEINIRQTRRLHHQQLVEANPEIPVGEFPDHLRPQTERLADGIHHHKIVAQPMHLGEPKRGALIPALLCHLLAPAHSGRQLSGASWSSRVSRRRTTCTWSPSTISSGGRFRVL